MRMMVWNLKIPLSEALEFSTRFTSWQMTLSVHPAHPTKGQNRVNAAEMRKPN